MLIRKVSKMGARMRVVYLPTAEFSRGERIRLKIVSKREYILRKVAKMGKYVVAVIPTAVWDLFPAGTRVSVKKIEEKK
jgi:hypothetical protein